mgnify:CR=1 FL=1
MVRTKSEEKIVEYLRTMEGRKSISDIAKATKVGHNQVKYYSLLLARDEENGVRVEKIGNMWIISKI